MTTCKATGTALAAVLAFSAWAGTPAVKVFDVMDFGAAGDGVTLDSPAIQRAVDAAAAAGGGAQVLVRGGHRYLIGTIELGGGIDFHIARGAELLISTNREHYKGDGVIVANGADHLRITGSGRISGRAKEFMERYDPVDEWWIFKEWRPKMFLLTRCDNLEVRDITFGEAPQWGLHMLGCKNVLVDHLTIQNLLDVPNCDGIDPDHCQDVEIRNCRIISGDDAIVIKSTRQAEDYGPSARIRIRDCILETQDSGIKIGTETTQDIHDVVAERCKIITSSRGLTIQLRDEGSVHDIVFRDIQLVSRYYSAPWWGRGEAISFTAIPRTPQTRLGALHHVSVSNVTCRAENSVRICGTPDSRIHDVRFENVALTLNRWTRYEGGVFDNRPTTVLAPIEPHNTPGFCVRYADNIAFNRCTVKWGRNRPDYFTHALEAEAVTGLGLTRFNGEAAHPARDPAVWVH